MVKQQMVNEKTCSLQIAVLNAELNWYTFLNSIMPQLVPCLRMIMVILMMYGSIALWGMLRVNFRVSKLLII